MPKSALLIGAIIFFAFSANAQKRPVLQLDSTIAKTRVVDIEVNAKTWKKIKKALDGVDDQLYSIEYIKSGSREGLGSADMERLSVLSIVGSKTSSLSNPNLIQAAAASARNAGVKEYIRLIWTAEGLTKAADRVKEVNRILDGQN